MSTSASGSSEDSIRSRNGEIDAVTNNCTCAKTRLRGSGRRNDVRWWSVRVRGDRARFGPTRPDEAERGRTIR
ncbi:MAG: hypothetical protein CMJ23_10610 [Phycisphaerae bacterium]|nr:hypothetical protein [Phycisphaerae bacterium]